jgi:hypothetical protein
MEAIGPYLGSMIYLWKMDKNGGFHVISNSREVEYAVASHRWPKVAIDATSSFHGAEDELLGWTDGDDRETEWNRWL